MENLSCPGDTLDPQRVEQIARLNDQARQGSLRNSRIVMTAGVASHLRGNAKADAMQNAAQILNQARLLKLIRSLPIGPGWDPRGERDMGAVQFLATKFLWKIDYYADDGTFQWGSETPWDASNTFRIMTIMLADEY